VAARPRPSAAATDVHPAQTGPDDHRRHGVRAQLNRILVVGALLVLLPAIVVAERVHRGAGRRLARWGVSVGATLCGVRFDVRGQEPALPGGQQVVVASHSSPMDIPALLYARPDIRFLAAEELFRIPLLASAMRALGTAPIDRRDHDRARGQLDRLVDDRQDGTSGELAIFPEGGIAPYGTRLPFKSGAFTLAIRSGGSILPVALHGTDRVLRPRGHLLVRPGVVTVEFLEVVRTDGLTLEDRYILRDHVEEVVTTAMAMTEQRR
jgi:1-acyl-sn-glycerol-3-phosphate acyltransferase